VSQTTSPRIVVTLDTEADDQWTHGAPLSTENVRWWAPFQALCERHGAPPTYLVTSEIADDDEAVAFLRPRVAGGTAEVGAHLHPWTTPPFDDGPGLGHNDPTHLYPCRLPTPLLEAKLEVLTAQIEERFAEAPVAFRAGRFGIDQRMATMLAGLGYVVDSSVTPFVSWATNDEPAADGGPDFRRHEAYPFHVAGTGDPGLVEVPVTVLPTYMALRRSAWLRDHWEAFALRAARRALRAWRRPQPMWLRPRPEYALADLEALVDEAERLCLPFAVLMFHSSELMPGGSPYRPTQASVDELLEMLDALFASLRRRGHGFVTLGAAGRELRAFDGLPGGRL
jgi:hypothetical protein